MNLIANLFAPRAVREQRDEVARLGKKLDLANRRLSEAYDDLDNRICDWERERDQLMGGGLSGRQGARQGGQDWPFLRNMQDLIDKRADSREACSGNGYGAGVLDRMIDFVIGDGMQPSVTLKGAAKGAVSTGVADADDDGEPDADPAVVAVQEVIDEFREANDWGCGEEDREEEGFRRSMRDGEVGVRFFKGGANANGIPWCRWFEPEQLNSPPSALLNERWGIRTEPDDVETKLAFWLYDMGGTGGKWYKASEIVWHKLGTDRTVLRGMPQFWLVARALQQCEALNSAVAEVSAIQARIAYVRQHAPGVMPGQISTFVGGTGDATTRKKTPYGDSYRRVGITEEGTTVDMSNGMQFTAGPVSTGVPAFVQALQSRLRQVCSRFGLPEFVTGDASNNNLASALVAGGPAERAFKRHQKRYGAFQAAVYRKACEYAVAAGRLGEEDLESVEITVKAGGVSIANKLEEAQVQQIRIQNKLLSPQTAMVQNGDDPRVEAANIEAWDAKFGSGALGLNGDQGDGQGGGQDQGGDGGDDSGDDSGDGGNTDSDGDQLLEPATESYSEEEYGWLVEHALLTEAQKNLLVKQVITDKNGKKTTRWVKAGGTMGGRADGSVQRAKMLEPGKGVKGDGPKGKAKATPKATAKPEPAKADSPKPDQKADLGYLPKDPKRLTISQAHQGLTDLGYTVGKTTHGSGHPDDPATVHATAPDGKGVELTPTQIKVLLYGETALPKAGKLSMTDLARLHRQAGAGKILGPAAMAGNKVTAWKVEDPDGKGEKMVGDTEVRGAVVKAKLARESVEGEREDAVRE